MTEALAPVAASDETERRALTQRAERICIELRRSLFGMLGVDLLVAALIALDGSIAAAAAWFVAFQVLQTLRRQRATAYMASTARDPQAFLQSMVRWWALLGMGRAAAVAIVFAIGSTNSQLLVTMITIGLAAGSVATSGDDVRVMRAWSVPAFGALALAWASHLDWQGVTLGLFIALLGRLLVGYVELGGQQARRLIEYSAQLERERDRVHEANVALERVGAELRAERDRAAEANAAKTRVLASVSHDLRQPLFALSLNTAALGDLLEGSDDLRLKRVEAGLRRSLDQCRGLLDQLVDFSRLEAGTVQIRWQAVELGPFLQSLAAPYEAAARAAGLHWSIELGAPTLRAWTDPLLLERLIGNLLGNAVKFTRSGRVGLVVRGATPERIRIDVVDTGPGIPAAEQQRVFEEFYQLDNPARDRARGLGLGLSIVRRLASLLDVGVRLDSAEGQGCRFVVEVPRSVASEPTLVPAPAEPVPVDAGRVLAIDDEPELLADLKLLLAGRGYEVLTACDIDEAVARAAAGAPDLVLADFRLRDGRTGIEAVAAVRRTVGRELPALLITGDTAPHRIAEAAASGLRVLHKPVDGQMLLQAVRETLRAQPPQCTTPPLAA